MPDPVALATALAEAHRAPVGELPAGPLLVDYAESSRDGDWSLRSALVRFAQPEPTRAGAVLELVRRTDGALKPHRRRLEGTLVPAHRELGGGASTAEPTLDATHADARAADLARILARIPDGPVVVDAYVAAEAVDDDELAAVGLLAVAVELDAIAEALVPWAVAHDGPPPVDAVERHGARAHARLDALGVPRQDAPPPRRPRG